MTLALVSAVEQAQKLSPEEQDILAAILFEEIASKHRGTQSCGKPEDVLELMAAEALADHESGKTYPLDELL